MANRECPLLRLPPRELVAAGFGLDRTRAPLGHGEATFRAAVQALRRWAMFDLDWVVLREPRAPIELGAHVGVDVSALGMTFRNECVIVDVLEQHGSVERFGFTYATLPRHVERGEESFTVEWQRCDDTVDYEIVAASKPRAWHARLGYPVVRRLQRRFALESCAAMQRATGATGAIERTSGHDWIGHARFSASIGATLWVAAVATLWPSPFGEAWAHALFLLAPLVIVPLALWLACSPDTRGAHGRAWRVAVLLQPIGALALVIAFLLPRGAGAAIAVLPWVAVALAMAAYGVARMRQHGWRSCELAIGAALAMPAIGAGWIVASRLGTEPLGFSTEIVLLTGVHFHHAGLALPLLAGLASCTLDARSGRLACAGVLAGVPLVAAGITTDQLGGGRALEVAAVGLLVASALLVAWLLARLALRRAAPGVRLCHLAAAVSLALAMPLAGLWVVRETIDWPRLDIPFLRASHGTLNALGFGTIGTIGAAIAAGARLGRGSKRATARDHAASARTAGG